MMGICILDEGLSHDYSGAGLGSRDRHPHSGCDGVNSTFLLIRQYRTSILR